MSTPVVFNGTTYNIPAASETGWSALSAFLIDVANNAQTLSAQRGAIRIATSSPVTVASTDYTVLSNLTIAGAVAVTLPAGVNKTLYIVGDTKGDAQTNNVTITPTSGTINGAATYVIKNNYGVVALQYSSSAAEWKVIGRYFTKIDAANEVYGVLSAANGGTGVANNAASTLTISGSFATTLTITGITTLTLPTSGTLTTTSSKLSVFAATTSAELATVISDETGTGLLVFGTSPTLTTPILGVAAATSINKVAITAPATSATLTIIDGKVATISNTLTFTGTDSSSVAFGTGGTVAYTANKLSVFASTTSAELAGVISNETGSGLLVFGTSPALDSPSITTAEILSAAAETRYFNAGNTFYVGFKGGNAAANKIWTLPLADGSANQVLSTNGSGTLSWATGLTSSLNQYNVTVGDSTNTAVSTNTNLLGNVKATTVSATATMTIATPCVVTYTSHGLTSGDKIYFTTSGALPTGVTASTSYYVTVIDANTFNLSTTVTNFLAATKIATSGSQSGTHTIFTGGINVIPTIAPNNFNYVGGTTYNSVSLAVTGTNSFSNVYSEFGPYQVADGTWRLWFNISGTHSNATGVVITIAGVTFYNAAASGDQAVGTWGNSTTVGARAICNRNAGTISCDFGSTNSAVSVSGDVKLNSKPTWAY